MGAYLIETRLKGGDWQRSSFNAASVSDAEFAVSKMQITVRSRGQSGTFEARVIPAKDRNWKREDKQPSVILLTDL